jgi:hypothetical protein
MMAPQLRLTIAPVIAPAPADARYTAVSATSASRGSRPSNVSLTLVGASASVMPAVSGAKFDLIPTTLTPLRNVLHDAVADRVERYVDAAGRLGHPGDVGFNRGRIHRIDMCRFGGAACPADLVGYLVELGQGPAGQEYSCSLAGERACHRAAH